MSSDSPPAARLTLRARRLLTGWAILLAVIFLVSGLVLFRSMQANRLAAAERHAVRLDPTADEPGATAADRTLPADAKPTLVTSGIYIDRILELSVKDVSWTIEFYLWFRWRGENLKSCEEFQLVDGTVENREKEEDETIAGERYQRFRVVGKITKFFDVTRFPCDEHLLIIAVELPANQRNEVMFVADAEGSSISSRVKVPAYDLKPIVVIEKPHSYKSSRGDPRLPVGVKATYSQLRAGVSIERSGWGLYFKLFQSLYIAILLALLAFFIKPTEVDPRFGLGVGALFAGVANAYVISSLVPDTGVMALADVVNGVGIAVILLTVVQSTISLHLYSNCGAEAVSRAFDRLSFALILPGYVLLNLLIPIGAVAPG